MPNVALHNIAGENIGEIALSENVFGAEVNQYAVHEVVKAYLDFIMSDEYGTHLEEQGYAVTSKMEVSR